MKKLESNRITPPSTVVVPHAHILVLGTFVIYAALAGSLNAQTPCPGISTFATGLVAPSKIIQTPRGNFIIAEAGPQGRTLFVVNGQGDVTLELQ